MRPALVMRRRALRDPPRRDHERFLEQFRRGRPDAGRERQHFVEIARVDDDACSARGGDAQPLVHRAGRADVESARWILDDDEPRRVGELSRQNELLLIAARQRANRRRVVRAANVILRDRNSSERAFVGGIDPSSSHARSPKSEILGDGEVEHERIVLPILGYESDRHGRRSAPEASTGDRTRTRSSSRCPAPSTRGNAKDLA